MANRIVGGKETFKMYRSRERKRERERSRSVKKERATDLRR